MASQGRGSIFKRTDRKYFIYLPTRLIENTAFPLKIEETATKILIWFKRGDKKLILKIG